MRTIKKKKVLCMISLFLIVFICVPTVCASSSDTIHTIEAYKDAGLLKHMGIISYMLRQLGWLLSQGLYYLVGGLEDVVLLINNLLGNFMNSEEFITFFDNFKPLLIGLLTISIALLGFMFMFKPKIDKPKIVTNLLVSIMVLVGLPFVMQELQKLTNTAIDGMRAENISIADQVLFENVMDVALYDNMGMPVPPPKLSPQINLSKSQVINIDPTETINYKDMREKDVWKNKVDYDSDGQPELKKNNKESFGIPFTSSMYYRFKIDFFSIFVTLLISALALILVGIKIARLLYELAINQAIAMFVAVTDFAGGHRLKKAIEMIVGTFCILFGCFFFLQLYVIGSAFCNEYIDNIFARLIALGALAWAVIDGPNLIERIIGIDAGINSGLRAISSAYMAGKTVSAISKGIGGFAKNTATKVGVAGGTAAGTVAGIANAYKETRPKTDRNSTKSSDTQSTALVPTGKSSDNNSRNTVSTAISKRSEQSIGASNLKTDTIGAVKYQENATTSSSQTEPLNTPQEKPNHNKYTENNPSSPTQNSGYTSIPEKPTKTVSQEPQYATSASIPPSVPANNEYAGRTWKTEKNAQLQNTRTSQAFKRSYNLTKNGITQAYNERISKPQEPQKPENKNVPNVPRVPVSDLMQTKPEKPTGLMESSQKEKREKE